MSKNTHTQRRVLYGTNVLIAISAAIAIAILINVVGYLRLFNFRLDWTATRKYSLSEQTEKVLKDLDGEYEIVALLGQSNEYINQVRDIVEEYGVLSNNITTQQIDPTSQYSRLEKFFGKLQTRFEGDLAPQKEMIETGRSALQRTREDMAEQLKLLGKLTSEKKITEEQFQQFVESVAAAFRRFDEDYKNINEQIDKALEEALPNFSGVLETLKSLLTQYDERIYAIAITQFQQRTEGDQTPNEVKEQLLRLVDLFKATQQQIRDANTAINTDLADDDYTNLRNQLSTSELVVVLGPTQVRVLKVTDMFREPTEQEKQMLEPGELPEFGFLGEEKLTGALIAMSLKHPPLVIFVQTGQRPVIGFQGEYENVASRLRSLNIEVQEWSPAGKQNPMTGQPMPAGPPPEPKEGQRVVWIIPHIQPQGNPMMMQMGGGPGQMIATQVSPRIEAGENAMIFLGLNPMSRFGQPDPLAQLVSTYGITAQTDRILLSEVTGPNRKPAVQAMHRTSKWPSGSSITSALGSLEGVFAQASPMTLSSGEDQGVTLFKLAEVSGEKLWAEDNLQNQNPRYNEEKAEESFTVAAAAQRDDSRIMVVTDPMWATDQITTYGLLGPGTAEVFGSAFPANAELFVNSTLWLAGLDELIAASARTQDIRRVDDMEESSLIALRLALLILLPLTITGIGIGVWLVRRRG